MATDPCSICGEGFTADQKSCQLLCDHTFHTECFLREGVRENYLADIRCHECHHRVVPNEMVEQNEAVHGEGVESQTLQLLFQSDPAFRTGLLGIRAASAKCTQTYNTYTRAKKTIITEHNSAIEDIKDLLKQRIKDTKTKLKQLPEFKAAQSADRSFHSTITRFRRRWGLDYGLWRIRSAIKDLKGKTEHDVEKYMPPHSLLTPFYRGRSMRELRVRI